MMRICFSEAIRDSIRRMKAAAKDVCLRVMASTGKYRCAVCQRRVRTFLPLPSYYTEHLRQYGWKYRFEDAETLNATAYSCPFCGATDRDRLYRLYLEKYFETLSPEEQITIIDFAPSYPLSRSIKALITASKLSVSYRTADLLMEHVDDIVDIENLQTFGDKSIDFFLCSHILEHVNDDRQALGELYRILKPGGCGILMVPIIASLIEIDEDPLVKDPAERWRRFGQADHVRLYSKRGFVQRILEAGFFLQQYGCDFFGPERFIRHGISLQSILYVVEKKC